MVRGEIPRQGRRAVQHETKRGVCERVYTLDLSGISWGNVLTLVGIVFASMWQYQANKRENQRVAREVQKEQFVLHTQNIEKMAKMETRLEFVHEWVREETRRRHPSGPHAAQHPSQD